MRARLHMDRSLFVSIIQDFVDARERSTDEFAIVAFQGADENATKASGFNRTLEADIHATQMEEQIAWIFGIAWIYVNILMIFGSFYDDSCG